MKSIHLTAVFALVCLLLPCSFAVAQRADQPGSMGASGPSDSATPPEPPQATRGPISAVSQPSQPAEKQRGGGRTRQSGAASPFGSAATGLGTPAGFGATTGFSSPFGSTVNAVVSTFADRPIIIVVHPLEPSAVAELKEDLNIMDKLLQDGINNAGGDASPDKAMGIRVTMGDNIQPMYIEECGVLFSFAVNLSLAESNSRAATAQKAPPTPPSPWERTRQELFGSSDATTSMPAAPAAGHTTREPFNQAKFEALLGAIVKTLPQANNIRRLRNSNTGGDAVIVTVTGFDDAGVPRRLSLRVKKSDIEAAANGTMMLEEFRSRVIWNAG